VPAQRLCRSHQLLEGTASFLPKLAPRSIAAAAARCSYRQRRRALREAERRLDATLRVLQAGKLLDLPRSRAR